MKKIIRGILLGLLAIIVVGGSVGAYMLFGQKEPAVERKPTVIDANGNTYLAVVDGDSKETMVAVTDANGDVYAVVTDKDGNLSSTVGNINDKVNKADLPTNYTGEKHSMTNTKNYTGDVVTEPQTTAPSTTKSADNNQTTTTKPKDDELKPYRIANLRDKYFSTGTYLMKFTTNDETMNESVGDTPLTMATKNNNVYVSTTFQSLSCEMLMLAPTSSSKDSKPTIYLILDKFKIYCKMPSDAIGDGESFNMGGAMKDFGSEIKDSDITVSKVSIDGKELICESYASKKDGATVKYFFDGDTLVRRDDVGKDGKVNSLFVSELTADVPDSLFEVPKNYRYLNMSALEKLGGK